MEILVFKIQKKKFKIKKEDKSLKFKPKIVYGPGKEFENAVLKFAREKF